jgi:HNH endonuclease
MLRSGSGYVYVYDDEGKIKLLSRTVMEKHLGRPLTKHEKVGYRNGDRTDCSIENLVLYLNAGIPFEHLVCKECGKRGNFEISSQE